MADPIQQTTRIPSMDFRGNKFVNEDGTLSETAQAFFDLLQNSLIKIIGNEGLVAPLQNSANITTIQNNVQTSITNIHAFTCQFGTFVYDTESNLVKVAVNRGDGSPVFKQVSLI